MLDCQMNTLCLRPLVVLNLSKIRLYIGIRVKESLIFTGCPLNYFRTKSASNYFCYRVLNATGDYWSAIQSCSNEDIYYSPNSAELISLKSEEFPTTGEDRWDSGLYDMVPALEAGSALNFSIGRYKSFNLVALALSSGADPLKIL